MDSDQTDTRAIISPIEQASTGLARIERYISTIKVMQDQIKTEVELVRSALSQLQERA